MWEYSWDPVPIETFDIGDADTVLAIPAARELNSKYSGLFHTAGRRMGEAKVEPFVIDLLPNTKPVFRRQYRYSPEELKFIESAVADMLAQGVIEEARSPWSAPIIFAKKEGGKARRVCNDFRGINEVTVGDNFPLPNVDDCLNILSGGMFFTTLDC